MEKQAIVCEFCNNYKMYVYINEYGICAITCTNCGTIRGGGAKIENTATVIKDSYKTF